MSYTLIFFEYLSWHYGGGTKEFLKAWFNIHWFWYHFFSIPVLINTFFKPYHRMNEGYSRGFDPQKFFETLIVNTILRIVGIMIRIVFISVGLLAQIATLIGGISLFIIYIASPIIIPAGLIFPFFLIL